LNRLGLLLVVVVVVVVGPGVQQSQRLRPQQWTRHKVVAAVAAVVLM
jgi:hypothetical protein